MLIGVLFKGWLDSRKLDHEGETALRSDMRAELAALRQELRDERLSCDRKIQAISERYEAQIASLQERLDGLYRQIAGMRMSETRIVEKLAGTAPINGGELAPLVQELDRRTGGNDGQ